MGYKDENIKHRVGVLTPKKGFKCPKCGDDKIYTKASLVVCPSCKKIVEGKDLI
jgi:predicted RNA-binding Zn-ribbon protein involved in translation (DUF1610 family)